MEGDPLEGAIDAASAEAVADQLLRSGLSPVQIDRAPGQDDLILLLKEKLRWGTRVKRDDLILFCRQMATLAKAGVPIIRSLRGMKDMAQKPGMVNVLKAMAEDLEGGRDLSAAMQKHPEVFSRLFRSMIQVGENTGKLDDAFLRMSAFLDQEKETVNRVKTVLRYPAFVLVAISVAIGVITFLVIPAFKQLYGSFHAELPWATKILIAISNFALAWWPYLLVGTVALVIGIKRYIDTEPGRMAWDRTKLRLPVVGDIVLRITMIRFARAFSMGYGAGVQMVQSLNLTSQAVGNVFVGSKIDELREGIERGDTLTRSAGGTGLFPSLVLQMLAVGEETGAVDKMMEEVAEFYEREVDYDLKYLASAIEPLLVVVMGAMVLILALGVFLPMWDLIRAARGV